MKAFLRNSLQAVLDFVLKILASPESVGPETFLAAFSAANHWLDFSTHTFIPHEGFMTQVFTYLAMGDLLVHGSVVSLKCTKIIKKLLVKSKFAKMLENVSSWKEAFGSVPVREQKFLELVVKYLKDNAPRFIAGSKNSDVEHDEDFLLKYNKILSVLCNNYEYLFTAEETRSSYGVVLFELMLVATRASNLRLSFEMLQIWCDLHSTFS